MNYNNQQPPTIKNMVSDAMRKRLEKFLNPPEPKKEDTRPKNTLWIANVAFNVMLAFLDFITAMTVGAMTMWYYGVLVFAAGYGPVLLWEFLYIRPYASKNQKYFAIAGAILGAISTVGVGILVGILNVVQINDLLGVGTLEMIIVISLVVLSALHIVLFGLYYFTDLGIVRNQKYTNALANHEDTMQSVKMAKMIAQEILQIGEELETEVREGRGGLVGAALTKIGSTNLLEDEKIAEPSRSNGTHP